MGLAHNTSVVRNGLVFYYDMNNTKKSFKGAPAANLVSSPNNISGWTTSLTPTLNQISLPAEVALVSPTTDMADLVTGIGYIAHTATAVTSGLQYMCSWYVKAYSSETSVYWNWGGSHAGSKATFSVSLSTGAVSGVTNTTSEILGVTDAGLGWWRIYCTTTMTGTACYPQLTFAVGGYLAGTQIEQSAYVTPFVIGTRTNTQALKDLTNNNTITATSLTYANDNTFSFNGSNYLQTGYTTALTDFTICVWFKASGNTGGYDRIIDKLYTTGTMLMRNSSSANSWGGGVLESTAPYGRFLTLTDGQWHFLVSVRQGTTHTLYGDGITNTISGTVSGTALNTNQFAVGSWYDNSSTQRFNGSVPVVQIYNRALSTTEVLQNFNAVRDRYGI